MLGLSRQRRAPVALHCLIGASVLLALVATGCTQADEPKYGPSTKVSESEERFGAIPPVRMDLLLPAGHGIAESAIRMPYPAQYQFVIAIRMPSSVRLRLWFTTSGGRRLDLLRGARADPCRDQDSEQTCRLRFPALEAQPEGTWMLFARDLSGRGGVASLSLRVEAVHA